VKAIKVVGTELPDELEAKGLSFSFLKGKNIASTFLNFVPY